MASQGVEGGVGLDPIPPGAAQIDRALDAVDGLGGVPHQGVRTGDVVQHEGLVGVRGEGTLSPLQTELMLAHVHVDDGTHIQGTSVLRI